MDDEWHWYEDKQNEFTFTETIYRHLATCMAFTDFMPDDHLQAFAAVAPLPCTFFPEIFRRISRNWELPDNQNFDVWEVDQEMVHPLTTRFSATNTKRGC